MTHWRAAARSMRKTFIGLRSQSATTTIPICRRIGGYVHLMIDYSQVLSVDDALARGRALDAENIYWLEEPIRHDDYAGAARLARELKVPLQIGENFSLPAAMATAIEQKATDYVMPDLERIGGVAGWGRGAGGGGAGRV